MDTSHFIDPRWLEAILGGSLFYPAAGSDIEEPLTALHEHIDTFWFSDIYPTGVKGVALGKQLLSYQLMASETRGDLDAEIEVRQSETGAVYRYLEPGSVWDMYGRDDGRRIFVVRRRGFGQIALVKEFSPRSLSVFMHRGDSRGECGSNAYFLANKQASYPPCANLFSKLAERLTDRALIISDGSNSHFSWLRRYHRDGVSGKTAFEYHADRPGRDFGGFKWTCVGWLAPRYGPTLVWGLERQDKG